MKSPFDRFAIYLLICCFLSFSVSASLTLLRSWASWQSYLVCKMHVRVRSAAGEEKIVALVSRLSRIDDLRRSISEKFDVPPHKQRLFYGGKLLENGYSLHDYNIKLNEVIQLMVWVDPVSQTKEEKKPEKTIIYEDTASRLYVVGDLIDMRDQEHGAWFEGIILRIVTKQEYSSKTKSSSTKIEEIGSNKESPKKEKVSSPKSEKEVTETSEEDKIEILNSSSGSKEKRKGVTPKLKRNTKAKKTAKSPKNGTSSKEKSQKTPNQPKEITEYSNKATRNKKVKNEENIDNDADHGVMDKKKISKNIDHNKVEGNKYNEDSILYQISLVYDDVKDELSHYCTASEIRPRARTDIPLEKLQVGQTVMLNHNTEDPYEKGYWYDFIVQDIVKQRKSTDLIGTLFLGAQAIPQNDTKIKILDKIYAIEEVVPIEKRTEEYSKLMITPTEQRALPLLCTTCRDKESRSCRDCGCNICAGKENPEKIVLCDECNNGFHMACLDPPMSQLPEEDWYCVECKRDPTTVVAPGAATQTKKKNRGRGRDWGRGMACVGKTQTCAMPANHFGPIPGIDVGMTWRFRMQLSESGVHRPPVSGIHGRDTEGAYSLVLSGGYEDDYDNGYEFTYTGSGGRDLSGNKRTADQSSDQQLTRENRALARNCAAPLSEKGADAGEGWRDGRSVRVSRSYKMAKHFPEYSPLEGVRYDGIYKVVKYYPEKGKSGFRVWKYLLRRDETSLAPWEKGAPKYSVIYPEGYLEAEAEKKKQKDKQTNKGKKRVLRENNHSDDENGLTDASVKSPVAKKSKIETPLAKRGRSTKYSTKKSPSPKTKSAKTNSTKAVNKLGKVLTDSEINSIHSDLLNAKLWEDCLEACGDMDKQGFLNQVQQIFLCIICQEVSTNPVTTTCQHNFCMSCLKLAFKSTNSHACPYCRQDLSKDELQLNANLKLTLQTLMPGYDGAKK